MYRRKSIFHINVFFTIILIIALYWVYIFLMNLMLLETEGVIVRITSSSGTYHIPGGRAQGYLPQELTWRSSEIIYRYEVNNRIFENSKKSNVLIFPNIVGTDRNVTVYYNRFFNGYSVLFRCDLKYFFINLIPFYILVIVVFFYKQNKLKDIKLLDLLKNYFGIDKSFYKKYNME